MKTIAKFLGKIILYATLAGSLIIDAQIIWYEWGYRGLVIAFIAYPLAFFATPIFSVIKYGRWIPVLITYGGGLLGLILFGLGGEFGDEENN